MTRLLGSELRRLTSRRLVRWSLLVWLVLVALLVVFITIRSKPDSFFYSDSIRISQLWLTDGFAAERGLPRDNVIATIAVLTLLQVIVIGASAVGAEYRAGTVGTVLVWEPRRVRLLVIRLLAAALVCMAFFLVVQAVLIGAWSVGALLRGHSDNADAEFWTNLLLVVLRGAVVAGVLAALSGALATLGKNTAAAMGVWFGYLIAVEGILRANVGDAVPWFLIPNLAAFYAWERVVQSGHVSTPGAATARLALYVVLLGGLALVVFRRRDVT